MRIKLKTGDEVLVLSGKDKGKRGKIERIFQKKESVIVAGVNLYKRHVKRDGNRPAGIIDLAKPLPVARVKLVCPKCNLPTKIGFNISGKQKERICKKCNQRI